ncbi:MAG: cobalt-precorrin-5B (C(1))-methyltransferase CbiD [Chloroflexota bacterium]|nr:cobalt-precorrin-5B (C(1))-methyltransferase CbiD [Chloroflexota bacterium]
MARRESDYSRPTVRRRGMRTGYTTGACAAAAAKAATLALLTGEPQREVTIRLPIGKDATFQIHRCEINRNDSVSDGNANLITTTTVLCSVIKDGGDDPDVTSGAEICARVWLKHDAATYAAAAAHAALAESAYSWCTQLVEFVEKYHYENWIIFNEAYISAQDAAKIGDVVAAAKHAHAAKSWLPLADDTAEEAILDAEAVLNSDNGPVTFEDCNDPEGAAEYFTDLESAAETMWKSYSEGDEQFWKVAEILGNPFTGSNFGVTLRGGDGVGTVTKPGTGIAVGDPSITRVPRRMITQAVREAAYDTDEEYLEDEDYADYAICTDLAYIVEISVPGGEEIAKKTDNPRLGIFDGISILGTTGVVQPFSTAAWRASVNVAINVAAANKLPHMVITTGTQSELFAKRWLALEDMAYVNVGIFTGSALERCVLNGIPRATLVGMVGKFSKIAMGYFVTHVAGNKVDPVFLASLAAECGASDDVQALMRDAASGRHFQEIALEHGAMQVFDLMCERVCDEARRYLNDKMHSRDADLRDRANDLIIDAICFDFEGGILGKASTSAAGIPLTAAAASDG